MARLSPEKAFLKCQSLANDFARKLYNSMVIEGGMTSAQALVAMRLFSMALNDYVPSNYKPNRKEAP